MLQDGVGILWELEVNTTSKLKDNCPSHSHNQKRR